MLISTLVKMIPDKGELRITLVRNASGVRLALIPKPSEVKEDSTDGELLAKQAAVISPIVLRFDPGVEGLDQSICEELSGYVPHVASAAERLAQYEAEQESRKKESDAAAKEKADKAKPKGKTTTKAIGKDKDTGKVAEAEKPAPDLFSSSVPASADGAATTAPTGDAAHDDAGNGEGADDPAPDAVAQDMGDAS